MAIYFVHVLVNDIVEKILNPENFWFPMFTGIVFKFYV